MCFIHKWNGRYLRFICTCVLAIMSENIQKDWGRCLVTIKISPLSWPMVRFYRCRISERVLNVTKSWNKICPINTDGILREISIMTCDLTRGNIVFLRCKIYLIFLLVDLIINSEFSSSGASRNSIALLQRFHNVLLWMVHLFHQSKILILSLHHVWKVVIVYHHCLWKTCFYIIVYHH